MAKTAQQKKDAALQALQDAHQDRTASQKKAQDAEKSLKDEGSRSDRAEEGTCRPSNGSGLAVFALLLAAAAVPLAAQSLLDNEFYHKAQDQLAQSQQALDAGDYDTSAALAAQAQDNLAEVERLHRAR